MIKKEILEKLENDFEKLQITKIKQCQVAEVSFPTLKRIYSGEVYKEKAIGKLIAFRDAKLGIVNQINQAI